MEGTLERWRSEKTAAYLSGAVAASAQAVEVLVKRITGGR